MLGSCLTQNLNYPEDAFSVLAINFSKIDIIHWRLLGATRSSLNRFSGFDCKFSWNIKGLWLIEFCLKWVLLLWKKTSLR